MMVNSGGWIASGTVRTPLQACSGITPCNYATNSSHIAMLIHPTYAPANEHRPGANQVRQCAGHQCCRATELSEFTCLTLRVHSTYARIGGHIRSGRSWIVWRTGRHAYQA